MQTILVSSQKGGSGKTTLVRNLSVAATGDGRSVLCLDLDPQGSLRGWWESRDADTPAMLDRDPVPEALRATLEAAKAQFDLCIIDTPPAAPGWLSEALSVADLVLIPVKPSPDDLRAVGATIAAVDAANVPFAFALSQTPRARITEEAARVLAQHGRVAPVNIAQRVAYAETGATGQGVSETTDDKAAAEIAAVWSYVKGLLNG
ncbi:ParA family protein [Actibacterium sp. 188UL27-1]|uniref:ParA family protein n=1 Tax=Actibacterium sp. 188UL27-1 TaxID=2786961 RepID=UPI00195D4ABD|nr:ParA family protein [Actibacterium sp. 188UL27-1]MBM7070346.1 ParA family protein [Actibacterium sp. 188UL27-1]